MFKDYFFVVGAPRSGTTMLQQALNRHSQVLIPPETAFFSLLHLGPAAQRVHLERINADLGIDLATPRGGVRPAARPLYEAMARKYAERLGRTGATAFGEKTPEHQRRLSDIRRLFPQAKVVLIYRDGRDVAQSLTRLAWMSDDVYVNFALWLYYYRIQRRAAADPNVYCVQYERLVAAPEAELRKVLHFLGLAYEANVAEGCGNAEGVPAWEAAWKARATTKIAADRAGAWRKELTAEQIARLERWGRSALQDLGYELLTGGRERLPLWFYPTVYARALRWLARRPLFGAARQHGGVRLKRAVDGMPACPGVGC